MSLHHLAKHMQSQGRDGDTGLVHMSPGEIGALQKLAVAHGGSLTINPETGLPEANFMRDWLPAIVGGLATIATGGLAAPYMIAAGTLGAFGTSMAVGNSFNKSLMAGLASGAGAGLGAGLGAAGAAASGTAGSSLGTGVAGAANVFGTGGQGILSQALTKAGTAGINVGAAEIGANLGANVAETATQTATQRAATEGGNFLYSNLGKIPGQQLVGSTPGQQLTGAEIYKAANMLDRPGYIAKGLGTVLDSPKAALDFAGANKGKLLALGTGIVGSNLADPQGINPPPPEVSTYAGPYKPVERTAQFPIGPQPYTDTSERSYFSDINPYPGYEAYADPKKKPISAADGGLMGLAGGGYDDEAGHDGYADGGEVGTRMATPDMNAIQSYVQSIGQPQQGNPNALQNYTQGLNPQQSDPNALQNYLSTLEQQRQQPTLGRPQVPDILRQMQAMPQQAPQIQTPQIQAPIAGGEYDYGFEPQQVIPLQYETPPPKNVDWYTQSRAKGGLTSLAKGGNYLDGPGDGLSDSIHATIGNNQPARLADGEFVISADVVSDIGGGSSKAGAKKLHAMMDRVRQSAHGTKKQVKKLDDRKVLAA